MKTKTKTTKIKTKISKTKDVPGHKTTSALRLSSNNLLINQ